MRRSNYLFLFAFQIVLFMQGNTPTTYAESLHEVFLKEPERPTQQLTATITLEKLLAQVQENHPKLYSADLERRIAGAKLLEKQGSFDPGISLETDYLRYNDFITPGKVSKTFDNDLSFNWLTRSGLKLSTGARYNNGDVKPPLYPTGEAGEYFFGVKIPLLRGFRVNEKVTAEKQAEIGIPLADAAYRETRLALLLQAAYAYWNWVMADRKVKVSSNLLDLAKVRSGVIQERLHQGDLPAIDAVEAQQEVQRREGLLAKAKREYDKHVFKLARYLWEPEGLPSPPPPSDSIPQSFQEPALFTPEDWMEGRRMALKKRPEIKALNLQKEINEVDLNYAKNQLLPTMDLFATPGYDTGKNSVGPTLKAGVTLMAPLRQRTAKGMVAATQFKLEKLNMEQRLLLQQVILEVDDAVSAINAAYQQYLAAKQEYQFSKELEQGEKDRFEAGDSTLFLVNQRERATAEASIKLIDLEAEYYQAVAYYKASTGQL